MHCHKCTTEIKLDGPIGRNETCSNCGADLRCCRNCTHYEPTCYNSCRESQAERVLDKEKRNFCDFFSFSKDRTPTPAGTASRDKLEKLFKN